MYKILAAILLSCSLFTNTFAKKHQGKSYKPYPVNSLPLVVHESSGLIVFDSLVWTLNDGGNPPCIYALDFQGKRIERTVCIENVQNVDWEALTSDENFVYIADVGNNRGNRNVLTIYKVKKLELILSEKVEAESIVFSYANKKEINPNHHSKWDCESIASIGDSLFLFSKNWEEPYCSVYKLPKIAGNYEISKVHHFYLDGLVTDATFNKNTNSLILVGYRDFVPFLIHFKEFDVEKMNFKKGKRHDFNRLIGYQVEGVAFLNDSTLFLSSEYDPLQPGTLFRMNLSK